MKLRPDREIDDRLTDTRITEMRCGHCSVMTALPVTPDEANHLAERVAQALHGTNRTAATAESITCGSIAASLAAAHDASQWFHGGVVAYTRNVKFSVLGVDPGPVITAGCARQMAVGAARLLGADVAVGTTGVGGPDAEEGQPAGTVFIAVATGVGCQVREYHFDGEPPDVVRNATIQALRDLVAVLDRDTTDRTVTAKPGT